MSTPLSPSKGIDNLRKEEVEYNKSLEDLLCEEAEKCKGLAWMHGQSEKVFRGKNNWIQIPIIILSTLSGGFQVGMSNVLDSRISQALGSLSFLVSMLGMISSHFRYAQRSEAHRVAAVAYNQIHRNISIEMSLNRNQRIPAKYLLKMIKEDLKGYLEHFPRIPDKVIENYKNDIKEKSEKGVKHPDVISGIEKIKVFKEEEYEAPVSNFNTPVGEKEEEVKEIRV